MKSQSYRILISTVILAGVFCNTVGADTIFYEDFESDLSAWTGKGGEAHSGIIVPDPLNPANSVLTFEAVTAYGDIFTAEAFTLAPGQQYTISFDYFGFANGVPGGSGGFAGIADGHDDYNHIWYAGTVAVSNADPILIDDATWRRYQYTFTSPMTLRDSDSFSNSIRLMFEDFNYRGVGIAGDAYFDNIALHAPLPGALLLGSLGLGLANWRLRRMRA